MRNQNKQVKASDYKLTHSNINVRVSLLSNETRWIHGWFTEGVTPAHHQTTGIYTIQQHQDIKRPQRDLK